MRTWLYIDGNHLQRAAFGGTDPVPVNPVALVEQAFPDNAVHCAKYFATPWTRPDFTPEQVATQRRYRALLRKLPNFYLIAGRFRRRMLPGAAGLRVEERGNDVNLTAHLLSDLMLGSFDAAIVVTGNPDLAAPIRLVRQFSGLPVGVLNPQRLSGPDRPLPCPCAELREAASFYQNGVTWSQLRRAQFAEPASRASG
ncbi:MAG: hypothetical protein ACKO3A_00580 [Opitutia bacterium]